MLSSEGGEPICIVKGGSGDGEIIFRTDEAKKPSVLRHPIKYAYISDPVGKFMQLPSSKVRILFIGGPSGSGKSTYVSEYVKIFKKLYPESKVILFSMIEEDPAFEDIELKRIVLDESLVENPVTLEEVTEGSLIIFDDIDTMIDKKLLDSLYTFQRQILEMGRHKDVKCIITCHLLGGANKKQMKVILNESHSITYFVGGANTHDFKYIVNEYLGLSKKDITKIMNLDGRWITFLVKYPQVLLSEKICTMFSTIEEALTKN